MFRQYNLNYKSESNNTFLNGGSLAIGTVANPKDLHFWQNTAGTIRVGAGDTLYVTDDVLMDNNSWGKNMIIDNNGVMIIGGDLLETNYNGFQINGVLVVCGNLTIGNINTGNGDIYVNGTTTGNISGPTLHSNFNDLVVDFPMVSAMVPCSGIPVPITLTSFSASQVNTTVHLFWQTVTELNNAYFTLEKSKTGTDWSELTTINGAGNSSVLTNYTAIDNHPYSGKSFYRIKQTNYDGEFQYFKIVTVLFEFHQSDKLMVYPNPTDKHTTIIGNPMELKKLNFIIY